MPKHKKVETLHKRIESFVGHELSNDEKLLVGCVVAKDTSSLPSVKALNNAIEKIVQEKVSIEIAMYEKHLAGLKAKL